MLGLDDQVLDAQAGEEQVAVADLVVDVARRPVEDGDEEVLEDALGRSLGRVAEALALPKTLKALLAEGFPAAADPLYAVAVGGEVVACVRGPTLLLPLVKSRVKRTPFRNASATASSAPAGAPPRLKLGSPDA
jgi:hypothetical protein